MTAVHSVNYRALGDCSQDECCCDCSQDDCCWDCSQHECCCKYDVTRTTVVILARTSCDCSQEECSNCNQDECCKCSQVECCSTCYQQRRNARHAVFREMQQIIEWEMPFIPQNIMVVVTVGFPGACVTTNILL